MNDTPKNKVGSEAEKIGLLEERISSLEDELYEAQQAPWPDWATSILKSLRKYGYDPVVDGEVDLGEALEDYLEGVAQAEAQEKTRAAALVELGNVVLAQAPAEATEFMGIPLAGIRSAIRALSSTTEGSDRG